MKVDDAKRTDPKIAAGRILAQEPAAGSTARRQRTVRVWLSAGPRATNVPGVTGESERTAQLRLTQNGFGLSALSEIRSQDFPADVVVAQEPPAKSPGASVALLVNRSDRGATYVMPDLIGVNGDRAAEALRQRGFRMAVVGSNPYPGIPAGHCPAPEPAGRLPDRAGRADFPRGEPVSVLLAPSILSADFAALGDAVAAVERGGADLIHVDVMDGHFVPNITIGPPVVRVAQAGRQGAARRAPDDRRTRIATSRRSPRPARRDLSVHVEVLPHLHRTVHAIKALGVKAGVVLNPSTPVAALHDIAADVDFVLVMSVNPGFGGQTFIPRSESKCERCARCSIVRGTRRRSKSTAASTWETSAGSSRPAPG